MRRTKRQYQKWNRFHLKKEINDKPKNRKILKKEKSNFRTCAKVYPITSNVAILNKETDDVIMSRYDVSNEK